MSYDALGPADAAVAHLSRARAVLVRPGVWTQAEYARDHVGQRVDSRCSRAERFCCSGALYATERPGDRPVLARVFLSQAIGGDIEAWNDAVGRKRDDVLMVFDRAIVLATAAAGSIEKNVR